MRVPFRTTSITFNGGDTVEVGDADVVALVGPNNTGKTRTLAEVQHKLALGHRQAEPANAFFVVQDVAIEQQVDGQELERWLREHRHSWEDPSDREERVRTVGGGGGDVPLRGVEGLWNSTNQDGRLAQLAPHLLRTLMCGERLQYLSSTPSRLGPAGHPEHPIQWLVQDQQKLDDFRTALWDAFRWNLIVDAWGQNIQLRLSKTETQDDFVAESREGMPPRELTDRLAQLPLIQQQSDGVRSFAGILLTLLTMPYPLVLIDEPEAFLHPPQARLLGRRLRSLQPEGQLFVATHSLDVLLGLVEFDPRRVLIVRLTRDGDETFAETLPPDQLARLWNDPLLRFSRALDGIYHDGVVVCEGSTDSQFYSAIADHIKGDDHAGSHVMFTYAGSKHRIPLITRALRGLDVPVRAIVDFDALRDDPTLRKLVEGLGGTYTDAMERSRSVIDAHLRGSTAKPTAESALESITNILKGRDSTEHISTHVASEVNDVLRPTTGWTDAKKTGRVPHGDATVELRQLLEDLKSAGLFVVPTGEVESFVPEIGGKGPSWVVEVVEQQKLETANRAHEFVDSVLKSISTDRAVRG